MKLHDSTRNNLHFCIISIARMNVCRQFFGGNLTYVFGLSILLFSTILLSPGLSLAQTATISGEVVDSESGETLPGANVIIHGTRYGASTDIDGRYTIRGLPAGEHTMVVRYMGFEQQSFEISVAADERLVYNIELVQEIMEGDEIQVIGYQRGQARALTRQRQSVNIRNVISAEQLDRFSDQTVQGALRRVSGMGHGGGANIRGVGAGMTRVSVDGQRMGSTGGNRTVNLSTLSADIVQELDVIKVITPDMPADALSGVINISLRRPIGGQRSMNVQSGGGMQPRYLDHTGPSYRVSLSYGDSPDDTYSFGFNVSFQQAPNASENFSPEWSTVNIPGYDVQDVLSATSSTYSFQQRARYSAGGQFTFQPSERTTYHFQGMFNYQDQLSNEHRTRAGINTQRYTTPNQTGPLAETHGVGHISYRNQIMDQSFFQYTLQAGARHLFDRFDMEYKLGWGHGRRHRDQYTLMWRNSRPGIDYFVNIDDPWYPVLEIAPHSHRIEYPNSTAMGRTEFLTHVVQPHTDNEVTATIDLEAPFGMGRLKFGGSAILAFQTGDEERFDMQWEARLGPADFPQYINSTWNVLGRPEMNYFIPHLVDGRKAIDIYEKRIPTAQKDVLNYGSSKSAFFRNNENIFSVYGMAELRYSILTFLVGARVEQMYARSEARDIVYSGDRLLGVLPIHSTVSYIDLFPNAQFIFSVTDYTNVRLAYSRSIGRASFTQLSPFREWDYDNRRVRHGNPELKPMTSDNLDFLIEHYFMNVGQISAGIFYKRLSDFIFSASSRVGEGGLDDMDNLPDETVRYDGWQRSTFCNGQEADMYGLELSWQQSLRFLPGFLGNLGTYANYTYTQSAAYIDRLDDAGNELSVPIQSQRPHIVNLGLEYLQGRFAGQVSYHWSAPFMSSYASQREWVPSIQLRERVYKDSYSDGANDVSVTVRYRIADNFRIWLDGSNLLNHRSVNYEYDRDYYPTSITLQGTQITIGLRYQL